MPPFELMKCLSDGEFHSGESLGRSLGMSRAAVWKQIKKLEELGIFVESVKGRGYRVVDGIDLLSIDRIRSKLSSCTLSSLASLDVLQTVDSTNAYVMGLSAESGANICLAEQQTAGRGRRGREWVSPYGKNIYLSCSWGYEGGAAVLEGLSLAVGVVLVRALNNLGLTGVELKWPNDLLWRGRKVAGVLLEMTGDAAGYCRVVVGIGLNVSMMEGASKDITQPWVSLSEVAECEKVALPSRNDITAEIIDQLLLLLAGYEESGFSAWRDEWMSIDAFRGREVCLLAGSQADIGVAVGVDQAGALLLDSAGILRSFSGGEVSLRPLESIQYDT